MLALIRLVVLALIIAVVAVIICLYSLLKPFHKNNVHVSCHFYKRLVKLLGLEVEVRIPESVKNIEPAVYISNHQNSWDIFTLANAIPKNTVTIGKKSLKWIPFFGQMYWLSGNILIDRKNSSKAMNTINVTAKKIKEKKLSVWLFPEGTRTQGRGIVSFKTGAFRTALQAGVPIVPVCASNTQHIDLNRWNNGKMIIEFLEPITLTEEHANNIRELANETREQLIEKFEQLNKETGHELVAKSKK